MEKQQRGKGVVVCLASACVTSRKSNLGMEQQVTRGEIKVQSINKHCGGSLGKQLSEVMDVFWKSPSQKTGLGALNKLKGKTVLVCFSSS